MHMCELSLLHRLAEGHYRQVKGSDTSPSLDPPLAALIGGVLPSGTLAPRPSPVCTGQRVQVS
jgi:hypothetical protein